MHEDDPGPAGGTPDDSRPTHPKARPATEETTRAIEGALEDQGHIGNYRILEQIGSGGMGEVYRAEQTQPIQRIVALKVIKRGMDTQQVIARFEAERQALALMDHPNIAKVFDAGTTPHGRPYFVMEYVKGVPITAYCDKQKLTTRERLELFIQVCDGVQHAHQKAIIHRDLKPSNLLVTIQDDTAVPKIIDFGVAKATAQKLTEKTVYTALGELIGTPEYMSPEQAEMTGEDVDTRTDVYSLGVVLYELLAGGLPFEPEELREHGFQGLVQMIREKDPPRPSTKANTPGERTKDIAAARRTLPSKLSSQLRGDLDWITMKSLEKDRTRRYPSAAELAVDVRRHLRHEPVSASPPTAGYRLRKFVRRYRVGVVAGSAVAVSLIAATVVSALFALREAEQRRVAATERDTAQAVNAFLNDDLLAAVAPSAEKGKGKDALMRDVLDEAAKRIDEAAGAGGKFADKPLVEASIRQTLGITYAKLGEYSTAEPHLQRARELRLRALGKEHEGTLKSMNGLANLYWKQGRYSDAESLFLEALDIGRSVLGKEHPNTVASMHGLATVYDDQGRRDEAKLLFLETLEIRTRTLGENDPQTLESMNNLAVLYWTQGDYDAAEPLFSKTLEIRTRILGEEHPQTLGAMKNLAMLYDNQGRHDEAEPLYLRALEVTTRILGEKHPQTLEVMNDLAILYMEVGHYKKAEPLLTNTLQARIRDLGEQHPLTLLSMMNLSELYCKQDQFEKAQPLQEKAVTGSRLAWPEGSWYIGAFLGEYGPTLAALKRYDDAERALLEAHEILTAAMGPGFERTINATRALAELYGVWGKPEQAVEWQAKLSAEEQAAKD